MSAELITPDAIQKMVSSEGADGFHPVLQAVSVKAISASSDRYRIVISDGSHYINGMLATQLNHMVTNEGLRTDTLIRVQDFMINIVQNRTVVILLGISVVGQLDHRVGNPVDFEKSGALSIPPTTAISAAQPLHNRTNNVYRQQQPDRKPVTPSSNPYGPPSASVPSQSSYQAPIVRSGAVAVHITPIDKLNMYANRWTIKARVTAKSDIRTWSNAKGEGSLFSVEFLDASNVDIRATFFKEAVDKWYSFLEVGKVYRVTGGRLKVANMQYNTCKSSFEMTLDQNAEIHLDNDGGDIKKQTYDFVKIANLENVEANKNVDVLAVVKNVGDVANLVSKKTGSELVKCDLTLVDDSAMEINLTLWGEKAKTAALEFAGHPVVAFRRARVSDYGGKSLSLSGSSEVNPDTPEVRPLMAWWQTEGLHGSATSRSLSSTSGGGGGVMAPLSERKDISAIKQENLGLTHADKADWISFKGTVTFIKKDKEGGAWYPACANAGEPCKNRFKVTQTTDAQWYCDKCQGTYPNCVRRWIFSAVVEDDSGSTWVSFFNEQAETLLNLTADEAYAKSYGDGGVEAQDQDAYDSMFARALQSEYIFKCKVKNEIVNDESRVKTSVYTMHPIDYVKECTDMLAALDKL